MLPLTQSSRPSLAPAMGNKTKQKKPSPRRVADVASPSSAASSPRTLSLVVAGLVAAGAATAAWMMHTTVHSTLKATTPGVASDKAAGAATDTATAAPAAPAAVVTPFAVADDGTPSSLETGAALESLVAKLLSAVAPETPNLEFALSLLSELDPSDPATRAVARAVGIRTAATPEGLPLLHHLFNLMPRAESHAETHAAVVSIMRGLVSLGADVNAPHPTGAEP